MSALAFSNVRLSRWMPGLLSAVAFSLSPAETPLRLNPAWDYPALGAGLAGAGYGFYQEWERSRHSLDPSSFHSSDIPAYDRWAIGYYSKPLSDISDVLLVAEGLAPVALTAGEWRQGRETFSEAWTDAVLYGEVVAYASALSLMAKTFEVHPRPIVFTDKAPDSDRKSGDSRSSFVSEHATGAFAAGVFTAYAFQLKHPGSEWIPWVWTGALGTATTVAALRVFSGKHFPSDVAGGAVIGSAVGYAVLRLHQFPIERGAGCEPAGFFSRLSMGFSMTPNGLIPIISFHVPG